MDGKPFWLSLIRPAIQGYNQGYASPGISNSQHLQKEQIINVKYYEGFLHAVA